MRFSRFYPNSISFRLWKELLFILNRWILFLHLALKYKKHCLWTKSQEDVRVWFLSWIILSLPSIPLCPFLLLEPYQSMMFQKEKLSNVHNRSLSSKEKNKNKNSSTKICFFNLRSLVCSNKKRIYSADTVLKCKS